MKQTIITAIASTLLLTGCLQQPILIDDFESGTFDKWIVEGDAFGTAPAEGTLPSQQEVSGYEGRFLANSFNGGDNTTGSLTSEEFTIERNYINFLAGGGMHQDTYIALIIEDSLVFASQALSESEQLQWLSWDVKKLLGKKARIKIVDNHKSGWGHILIDRIEMNNSAKSDFILNYELTFDVTQPYLLIPIEDKAQECRFVVKRDGKKVGEEITIRLAAAKIDYWVPIYVGDYIGKSISWEFNYIKKNDIGYSQIKQADSFEYDYNETYRPLYHFTPEYGWMNDPNGMVYLNGEYHLFYQHNPYGSMWGNMHWGHAVSKDLITWEYHPNAIAPDHNGAIFSGSAVIDEQNTAGFGKNALVAIFTSAGNRQTQSLAYSMDNGRTFTMYENNPVLSDSTIIDFRDPKVFWHAKTSRWIMSLATSQTISFYASDNLKEWKKLSEFGEGIGAHGGVWECPDLFELTTPDGKNKWVLLVSINPGGPNGGSATQYFIGDFDGKEFKADPLPYPLWIDHGRDNYAGVTWNNIPQEDGRRLFIGWMSNWDYANDVPSTHFRSASTFPRELFIKSNGNHLMLASKPVREIEKLRQKSQQHLDLQIDKNEKTIDKLLNENSGAFELTMTIQPNTSDTFGFGFINTKGEHLCFTFDLALNKLLMIDRKEAGNSSFNDKFATEIEAPLVKKEEYHVRLLVDKASVELFINDGEIVSTNLIFPREIFNTMNFFTTKGTWTAKNIQVFPLKSTMKRQ